MLCVVCGSDVHPERVKARGLYCMSTDCVRASLLARQDERPLVLVNGHKSGWEPMFLADVRVQAKHTKKG